ncbi:MAG: RagB/SusD family nutrient uptake outer membrane protein [Rikenellaceae bacterium]|nr:RagB/SusD family nutrient uptake outer membrane protein [Rikenellaceae bacterium]MCL2691896.1 RagB/SusD family nutrient uptake outer membrane protein [Rikenellaceae bacterium]
MKNKNIFRFAALVFAVCVMGTSCNDWLDVRPKAEEDAEDLFSTVDGFKAALAGCYIPLTQTSLYGRELTFGVLGVLAQEWGSGASLNSTSGLYYNFAQYDYEQSNTETAIAAIWSRMYYVIAQCNTLIKFTESNRSVLNDLQYAIIRGEALALRAFAHAELFRLFGKVSDNPATQKALPYLRSITVGVSSQVTNDVYYEYLLDDIDEALKLLAKDPIYTGQDVSGLENGYYINRHFHMNYYAALALKARMQLHMGDRSGALQTAMTVIAAQNDTRFRWITIGEVNPTNPNLRDRTFSTEHIFALNIMELRDYVRGYFRDSESMLTGRLDVNTLFAAQDYRHRLFEAHYGMVDVFSKFWQMDPVGGVTPRKNRMPLIRITEMYYIAIEAQIQSNPTEALRLLNIVRAHRNLPELPGTTLDTPGLLANEYLQENQREFMGEGQLWFYHKRQGTETIFARRANYILPIPVSELEFGDVERIN